MHVFKDKYAYDWKSMTVTGSQLFYLRTELN